MLDWFPFRNGFHVSPMVNFSNNNTVRATVLVPSGSTITLSGSNYISSLTDPLHGSGSVGFRKTSPGLTVGWGNIVPRSNKHLSFPVELGFYYEGQPTLKVAFTGSACDPSQPASIGCESVNNDAGFQQSLTQFTARNNHNLSYASFFPVLSTGVGYQLLASSRGWGREIHRGETVKITGDQSDSEGNPHPWHHSPFPAALK